MSESEIPLNLHLLNSAFSGEVPGMQLAVDSYSLGEFKLCPRRYYYSIIWGWQSRETSIHLTFGLLIHAARERYDLARSEGLDHDEALKRVLYWGLNKTWVKELKRPWISEHPNKNRETFIRSIIWYLDANGGAEDKLKTLVDATGKPLVELHFKFDSGYMTMGSGEMILLCGYGDRIASLEGVPYWVDSKTTERPLDGKYLSQFTPNNQFSLYNVAGKVVYQIPTQGLIVDALQVGATFTRTKRALIERKDSQNEEWLRGFGWWTEQMEHSATTEHWPMNDKSCDMFGGCHFRKVCSLPPGARQRALEMDFVRRTWNPLEKRGDV